MPRPGFTTSQNTGANPENEGADITSSMVSRQAVLGGSVPRRDLQISEIEDKSRFTRVQHRGLRQPAAFTQCRDLIPFTKKPKYLSAL